MIHRMKKEVGKIILLCTYDNITIKRSVIFYFYIVHVTYLCNAEAILREVSGNSFVTVVIWELVVGMDNLMVQFLRWRCAILVSVVLLSFCCCQVVTVSCHFFNYAHHLSRYQLPHLPHITFHLYVSTYYLDHSPFHLVKPYCSNNTAIIISRHFTVEKILLVDICCSACVHLSLTLTSSHFLSLSTLASQHPGKTINYISQIRGTHTDALIKRSQKLSCFTISLTLSFVHFLISSCLLLLTPSYILFYLNM